MRWFGSFVLVVMCGLMFAGTAQARALKGKALVGDYAVAWGEMGKPSGAAQKTMLFFFSWKDPSRASGVSEADWAHEAARQKVSVATLKQIMGPDVYRPARGGVAVCTVAAVQKGICGRKLGLSEKARAEIAATLLAKDGRCVSAGFDAAYHRQMATALGAQDMILVLRATCRR